MAMADASVAPLADASVAPLADTDTDTDSSEPDTSSSSAPDLAFADETAPRTPYCCCGCCGCCRTCGDCCWAHCLRPARPWTRTQSVGSFVLGLLACVWCSLRIQDLNRNRAIDINPTSGAAAEIVCVAAALLTVVYMALVAAVAKRCVCGGDEAPATVREALSIHSVPYQLALGVCGMIYLWVWITRMHGTKIVDVRHCDRVQPSGSIEEVIRLQHPTSINWTAVDKCDLGPVLKPPDPAAVSTSGEPAARPPGPTWFTVANDDRLLSWREHLVDQAMTLVFFTHLVVHGTLHWLDGWRGDTAFSWFAPLTNPLTCVDILVVGSVLLATTTDDNVRDAYSMGGALRVFLLFHPLFCIEWYLRRRKEKKKYGRISHAIAIFVAVLKLLFVCFLGAALMYMSEQPCEVVLDDYRNRNGTCDVNFRTFGHVVYFTFVTLSTVGYGDMSPQTPLGRTLVVFVILFGISYLPGAIADILHMGQNAKDEEATKEKRRGGSPHHHTHKKRKVAGQNEETKTTTLQRILDDLQALKERDDLLLQTIARQQSSAAASAAGRQVGFFQHGGTLDARGSNTNSAVLTGGGSGDALAKTASRDMMRMFIERRSLISKEKVGGGAGEEAEEAEAGEKQERKMTGQLFHAACARLEEAHGGDKIAQCAALLGLEVGGGARGLVEHVLGLAVTEEAV